MTEKPGFDIFRAALPYPDKRAQIGLQLTDIEALGFTHDGVRAQMYYDHWHPTSKVKHVEPARPPRRNNAALKKFRRGRIPGFLVGIPVAFALVWLIVTAAQGAIVRAQAEHVAAEQQTGLIGKATDYVLGTGQDQAYTGIIDWAGCEVALANGTVPIPKDHPGYSPALDANHDGLACDPAAGEIKSLIGDDIPETSTDVYYPDCIAVWGSLGRALNSADPGYETPRLDTDGDGTACTTPFG